MAIVRENIYSAIWTPFSSLSQFNTKSRRLVHWADVDKANQPALFMSERAEEAKPQEGMPTEWKLFFDFYIYAWNETYEIPSVCINPLLDLVCNTLSQNFTRGNVVVDENVTLKQCKVEGRVETDEGALGFQSIAIIPVTITLLTNV